MSDYLKYFLPAEAGGHRILETLLDKSRNNNFVSYYFLKFFKIYLLKNFLRTVGFCNLIWVAIAKKLAVKSPSYTIISIIVNDLFFTSQIPQPNSQEKWKWTISKGIQRWSEVLKTYGTYGRYFQPSSQEKWSRTLFENFLNWKILNMTLISLKEVIN